MIRFFLIIFSLFLVFPMQSKAQDQNEREVCRILEEHVPFNDVEYQPGVDVRGNPVVPADLNSSPQPFTSFEIPVTIELAQRLDLDIDALDLEPVVGLLSVTDDNRVLFNGQDITSRTVVYCNDPEGTEVITEEAVIPIQSEEPMVTDNSGQAASAPVSSEDVEVGSRDEPNVEIDNAPIVGSYGQNTLNTVTNN